MALSDVVIQRADAVTLIVRLLLAWLAWQTVKTLYQGFRVRMKFRRMQSEGIVSLVAAGWESSERKRKGAGGLL